MAPAAISNAAEELEEVFSKPPEGIILPPKELRSIVEKTAGYVARNGTGFETRIINKEGTTGKFSFLVPGDAYYGFYQWRISEIKEGRTTAVAAGREGEALKKQAQKPAGPTEPPSFHFSARMPTINSVDLETVKLTALFVARNGTSFMTALNQRENQNPQFEFLRPQHSLYQYFSKLLEQYRSLLAGDTTEGAKIEKSRIAELEANVKDKFRILGRAKQRAEWTKYVEAQKAKKEEQEEKEKLEYAQVDWQDWALAETVLFTEEDDQSELPPPTSLNELQSMSLEQKAMTSSSLRIEEAAPDEDLSQYAHLQAPSQQQTQQQAPPPPPPMLPQMPQMPQMPMAMPQFPPTNPYAPQPVQYLYAPQPGYPMPLPLQQQQPAYPGQQQPPFEVPQKRSAPEDEEEAARIEERRLENERAQQARAAAGAAPAPVRMQQAVPPRGRGRTRVQMAQCPQCKEMFPVDELNEHMRIELLDPEWRKQRAKADARFATTNLSTANVADNLKRLAQQRTDVFDPVTGRPTQY